MEILQRIISGSEIILFDFEMHRKICIFINISRSIFRYVIRATWQSKNATEVSVASDWVFRTNAHGSYGIV